MQTILLIIHVIVALTLIGLILVQHGKGADAGAAFGSGASASVFGSQGSANFLTRVTGILATVFFILSLALAFIAGQNTKKTSVVDQLVPETQIEAPVVPAKKSAEDVPVILEKPAESDKPAVPE
ncbi:MAG: preprotein translocase subunit SecG [Gammaproteobacteria bacterium]|nr:preprotein translocase subunit SecG [Gammaproteobacteria bacterium]